jgi:hypothetical protein
MPRWRWLSRSTCCTATVESAFRVSALVWWRHRWSPASTSTQSAEVAEIVVDALREERFLIITHPARVQGVQLRATDPTGYLDAMRSLWASVGGSA